MCNLQLQNIYLYSFYTEGIYKSLNLSVIYQLEEGRCEEVIFMANNFAKIPTIATWQPV